ncbi:DUF2934 domain-containing protein [Aureimonas phyllosphaerae]|uniref:DUF2934 domain-containing protein n=1 Tax=Aureimonas phyllosphaerae TaxID=1166078 RepID=A0A7W6FVS9_9HYPH|nr:DUF2934 domain-containing protein [Aureimonas phyllosphaerae]MBB3937574.1 hypothetical protein [Aureimonas phyllosphaerae]MBB3961626.1 hypothetical protein [Aureimonas phyllosphaerae]SFF46527.1 Protein of unknown function [Aureimonas phyllosphaerae]
MTMMSQHPLTGAACSISTGCLEDMSKRVRDRAYQLWEAAGRPWGHEHEFWARASAEIEGEWLMQGKPERIVAR